MTAPTPPADELLTTRLSLRRPETGDAAAVLAVHADPLACAHNPADALATMAEAEELLGRWQDHWQRFGFGYWVVRRRGTDPVLGFCGLKVMRLRDEPVLNLFYRLDPACWGGGVATEAATEVVRWAALLGQPVVARVRPGNFASQRVAARAGLTRAEHLDEDGQDGPDWLYVLA
jgi:[ribosomal protein S5]-alanine N-acetyltransferase